jgi:hypothetical protein
MAKARKKCQRPNGQLKPGWTYTKGGACKKAKSKRKSKR